MVTIFLIKNPKKGNAGRYLLMVLLPLTLFIGLIAWLYLSLESDARLHLLIKEKQGTLALQKKEVEKHYSVIEADIQYIAHEIEEIRKLQSDDHAFIATLKENFSLLVKTKKIYHQVRVIGLDGMELIRINFNGEDAVVVPDDQLQSKTDRYYFEESSLLPANRVYASQLDLNVEQSTVQLPYVPTIRLGKAIFDGNGQKSAILIFNYLAANLLDDIKKINASTLAGSTYLINSDGYWLIGAEQTLEWGFMFADREELTFQKQHPDAWRTIRGGEQGCISNAMGMYCFTRVNPLQESDAVDHGQLAWTLISFTPESELYALMADTRQTALTLGLTAFIVSLLIAWLFTITIGGYLQANEVVRKLSKAVEQAGESVIITDSEGTIEYVNDAFTKVTGFSREEVLGENPRILKSGNQPDEYYKRLWQTITRGEVFYSTVVDRRKDGSQYPALMTVSPILDHKGRITHYVGLQQDMTSHDALEKQFHQAQKMETLGMLIGGIAHDFNNILMGITSNITMAMFDLHSSPASKSKLETAEKLAFQAAHKIRQLMAYSQKGVIFMKPLGLISFIDDIFPLLRTTIPANIAFHTSFPPAELVIRGDPTQLQKVLLNMISNAVDALEATANPLITLSIAPFEADDAFMTGNSIVSTNQFARITIEDNGCGIAGEQLDHLFEPFYTTKEAGLSSGLGLSMVLGTVQSHHGVIEVASKPGKGASFQIYLPLIEEGEFLIAADDAAEIVSGHGELIMVADDNAHVRASVKSILKQLNYKVIEAVDGVDAVDKYVASQKEIRLIIMDVIMPRMSGVIAAHRIRNLRQGAAIIFSTGYDKEESLKKEMPPDHEIVLTKPYSVAGLSRLVQAQLNLAKSS